jgi:hypothetical protein
LLEEHTKAEASRTASERSQLQADREDYEKDLQELADREHAVARREKKLKK